MWKDNDDRICDIVDIINTKEIKVPEICPVCGKKELHFFLFKYPDEEKRGGAWIWCSECKHFSHFEYVIPQWWKNYEGISFDELTSDPDLLESKKEEIDFWIKHLISAES